MAEVKNHFFLIFSLKFFTLLTEPVREIVTGSDYGVSAFLTKLIVMNHLMANKKNPGDEVSSVARG